MWAGELLLVSGKRLLKFHTTDVLKKNDLLNRVVCALARISSFGFLGERVLQVDAYCGSVSLRGSSRSCSS